MEDNEVSDFAHSVLYYSHIIRVESIVINRDNFYN